MEPGNATVASTKSFRSGMQVEIIRGAVGSPKTGALTIFFLLWSLTGLVRAQDINVLSHGEQTFTAVRVTDLDESIPWYMSMFGVTPVDTLESDSGIWKIVNLASPGHWIELIHDTRATDEDRPKGFFKTGYRVADIEAMAEHIESVTGVEERIVSIERHQVKVVQTRDPDGNVWQFMADL